MNNRAPTPSRSSENDRIILETAIEALANTTGIAGKITKWQADMGAMFDAAIELQVNGKHYPYFAEIKHIDRVAILDRIKPHLDSSNQAWLLVAPRISADLADKLREAGVQFIDASGNAYLRAPGLYATVKGQRPTKNSQLDTILGSGQRAGSVSAARIAFVLLCAPEMLNAPYRELSHAAGVSLGTIGAALNGFAKRGFINNAKENRRFLEKEALLREWVTTYPIKLRPKLAPRRFRAADPYWWQSIDIEHYNAAWGGEIAADKMTAYLKPANITIYMQAKTIRQYLGKLVVDNKLRADPEGDIEILESFWNLPADRAPKGSVPPLLIYADLMASMDSRNIEVAQRIYPDLLNEN